MANDVDEWCGISDPTYVNPRILITRSLLVIAWAMNTMWEVLVGSEREVELDASEIQHVAVCTGIQEPVYSTSFVVDEDAELRAWVSLQCLKHFVLELRVELFVKQ